MPASGAILRSARLRAGLAWLAIALAGIVALLSAPRADATRNLYTTGVFGPPVGAFDLAADGALSPVAGSPFGPPADNSTAVALTPDGRFLYATDAGTQKVLAFRVGAEGGLTQLTGITFPGPGDPDPTGIAISPSGSHAYVADPGPEGVRVLTIGGDGSLTEKATTPVPGADFVRGVAITPDGRYLYATSSNPPAGVYGFTIGPDGGLTPLGGFPEAISSGPDAMTVTPDGRFLYVARNFLTGILGYAIGADGSLTETPSSPYAFSVSALAADPTAGRLFASYASDPGGVLVINVNANGSLTAVPGGFLAISHATAALATTPDASHIYAGGGLGMNAKVSGFSLSLAGVPILVPGSPFDPQAELAIPQGYAVSPNQPPVAAFGPSKGAVRNEVVFDGSPSADPDGNVSEYAWDFGDGSPPSTTGPGVTHAYAEDRVYTATLTTTDDEGCSTSQVFTGQTMACNGGASARAQFEVDLVPPVLTLSGKKSQRLGKAIKVKASCDGSCDVVAGGTVAVKGGKGKRKLRLKGTSRELTAGQTVALKLKLSGASRKKAAKALEGGAGLKAKVSVTASEELTSPTLKKRSVRLKG